KLLRTNAGPLFQLRPRQPGLPAFLVHPPADLRRNGILAREAPGCRGDVLGQQLHGPLAAEAVRGDPGEERLNAPVSKYMNRIPRAQPPAVPELFLVNTADDPEPQE